MQRRIMLRREFTEGDQEQPTQAVIWLVENLCRFEPLPFEPLPFDWVDLIT